MWVTMNIVANLNLKSMVSPQALQDHQELHTPTTMWMPMSAVANTNRKSMVQTINKIKMANNKDIMKIPHTRTSSTTTPREGSPHELQDRQVMR
jgi:hypothetical protein